MTTHTHTELAKEDNIVEGHTDEDYDNPLQRGISDQDFQDLDEPEPEEPISIKGRVAVSTSKIQEIRFDLDVEISPNLVKSIFKPQHANWMKNI